LAFSRADIPFPCCRNNTDVFTMNSDGSGLTNLTSGGGDYGDDGPVWSPDGTKITYTRRDQEIRVMNEDGSDDVLVASGQGPDWQPIINQPPDCSGVTANPRSLRLANHHFRTVTLAGASDPDGDAITIAIDGVTQDEPVGRRPDARAGGSADEVKLRAQRDPRGDGRVYRIAFTASDGAGGECSGEATVEVRRKKNQPAVDSAPPSYDSFG